ncbi:MAG: cAMP/cGMP-dependent 3',5'-cyclic-AMP/GMP phosphodiesterase [Desulfohalobiaceae bacterium]|nr:cAMP/cGMP-dependent 3',5'-cyclic-AMP/GMP phosphodiesterase [Desulfohalobiaceae bacterium]
MHTTRDAVIFLPRGGAAISTTLGPIQFGSPPETIKDTMTTEHGVPDTFIVPQTLFNLQTGASCADLEFPIYFNFFIQKRKTRIVCTAAQQARLTTVISESIFGPESLNIEQDFAHGINAPGFPDLRAEMNFFRTLPPPAGGLMVLEDLVEFLLFDDQGRACVDDLEIVYAAQNRLFVLEKGSLIAEIDPEACMQAQSLEEDPSDTIFHPPLFGITTLGAGHGFDPQGMTSGMILWLNRRGVVVDPPVHSTLNLQKLGVNPKLIDSVLLTHCHADHDAGTLQKLLQEGKLSLYTTTTVYTSFLRKSAALTGIAESLLQKLVRFFPVRVGEPINIKGGEFHFRYTLHSIPTVAFEVAFAGKSMIYSSDTLNHPDQIQTLFEDGVLTRERRDHLLDFPWDHSVIFHEAGIPPLHTPLEYLCSLPRNIRERMYLVHVSPGSIPKDCGLRIAPTGLANTLELDVSPLPYAEAIEVLDIFSHLDIFEGLPIDKAREFLIVSNQEHYRQGEVVFRKGDPGDTFYFVLHGKVDITLGDRVLTTYSNSDYFGERILFSDHRRSATALARADCTLLAVAKPEMLSFIRGTESERLLRDLAVYQNAALRDIMHHNTILAGLTPSQQTQLHRAIKPLDQKATAGSVLRAEGALMNACFLIGSGSVGVYQGERLLDTLRVGDLFGIRAFFSGTGRSAYRFQTLDAVELYRIENAALGQYLDNNPGVWVRLYQYPY